MRVALRRVEQRGAQPGLSGSNRSAVIGQRKVFRFALCALVVALCGTALAQESKPVRRIGFLGAAFSSSNPARRAALLEGLEALGWVQGRTLVIEWRFADGNRARLAQLASEFTRRPVEVIVTGGPAPTRALKQAKVTIPVVMGFDNDPVGAGFVESLARPGGNITGLSTLSPEISGKQLELLKEAIPKLSRVAVLANSTEPGNPQSLKELEQAARASRVQLQYIDVLKEQDLDAAFKAATTNDADAAVVLGSPVATAKRKLIAGFALKNKLPTIYPWPEFVEDGGLVSYGANITDLFRRAAVYVDKILKGAKPSDLPVEQPTRFELVINLKAAKQIGLTIPPNVLARADKVIR